MQLLTTSPMNKKKKQLVFTETYIIRYDIKIGEYWKRNQSEEIQVPCGNSEKNNFSLAEREFLNKHKGEQIDIICSTYV